MTRLPVTPADAAAIIHVSRRTMRRWIADGKLTPAPDGTLDYAQVEQLWHTNRSTKLRNLRGRTGCASPNDRL